MVRDREHPFVEVLITDEAGVVDPQLPVLTKVSCLVDALKMGGSYGLIKKAWAQFVIAAGPVLSEVAWTRDEVLVGSVDFRNHFVSTLIHIVVLHSVNHRYWDAALNSAARGWLGEGSPFLQPWTRGAWCVVVGLHADKGDRHFPSGCCGHYRPFCRWCHTRVISGWVSCGCSRWFSVPCCCFWRVACVGRHLRQVSGKWVQSQAGGVPVFDLRLLKRCLQKVTSSFLDLWIPSQWRSLLSHVWRVQSIPTGWCPVPVFVVPSSQESCRCRRLLRSSTTSWECGLSTWSTSRRLVERLTATA